MHQPRPYGQAGAVTDGDRAALDALVRQLTNLKQLSGLPSFKLVRALPSGATAIAQDMGGVLKVIVQPQREEAAQTEDEDGLATTDIPMMFSGVIDQGVVPRGAGVTLKLSASTINRLARQRITVGAQATLQRFAIGLPTHCSELLPMWLNDGTRNITQYANLRPTWWSNGMAEVVQIVGGYGRQDFDNLPDTPAERAMLVLPQSVIDDIAAELGTVRLPGYAGKPPTDGGIRYDYKFTTTHGVGFDSAGKPWLVRMGTDGGFVMPLPLVPATTTAAFRRYVNDVGDDELKWALDRFGGLPSGESFPDSTKDFEAWRRAGVIIKLCDTSDFYLRSPYSTSMGWTFNHSGTESFNTAYSVAYPVVDGQPPAFSYAYKLRMELGTTAKNGYVRDPVNPDGHNAQMLARYLAGVSAITQDRDATNLAIHYKMRRAGAAAIMQRAQLLVGTDYHGECAYWDNLVMPPIASHNGSLDLIEKAGISNIFDWITPVYAPTEPGKTIKQDLGLGSGVGASNSTAPASDAPVMGYYIGDDLKIVRSSYSLLSNGKWLVANGQPTDFNGRPIYTGPASYLTVWGVDTRVYGSAYSSDLDPRAHDTPRVLQTIATEVTYDYSESGERAIPDDNGNVVVIQYFTTEFLKAVTSADNVSSVGIARSIVCTPAMDRNAALYVKYRNGARGERSTTVSSGAVQRSYGRDVIISTGEVFPWGPQDYWRNWSMPDTRSSGPFKEPDTGYVAFSSVSNPVHISDAAPEIGYFGVSDTLDEYGFFRSATKVAAGACSYANVTGEHGGPRVAQGTCNLADNSKAHHFIGVINE